MPALRPIVAKRRRIPSPPGPGNAAIDRHGKSKGPLRRFRRRSSPVRHTPAEKAVSQAIDAIDPYDPAAFNNQANAPTTLATPAAQVLKWRPEACSLQMWIVAAGKS